MFTINAGITDLQVKDRNLFKILYSMNSHPVAAPDMSVEEARCYILFFSEGPNLSAYIGLYLPNTDRKFFYSYATNPFPYEAAADVEADARTFAEDMGFLLDEINVSGMAAEDRNHWIEEQDIFSSVKRVAEDEEAAEAAEEEAHSAEEGSGPEKEAAPEESPQPEEEPNAERKEEQPAPVETAPAAATASPPQKQEPQEAPAAAQTAPAAVPTAPQPEPVLPQQAYQPPQPVQQQYPPAVPPQPYPGGYAQPLQPYQQPSPYPAYPPPPGQQQYPPQQPVPQQYPSPQPYPGTYPPQGQPYQQPPAYPAYPPQPAPMQPPMEEAEQSELEDDDSAAGRPQTKRGAVPAAKPAGRKKAPPSRPEQPAGEARRAAESAEMAEEIETGEERPSAPRKPVKASSVFEEAIRQGVMKPPKPKVQQAARSAAAVVTRDKEALARLLASF